MKRIKLGILQTNHDKSVEVGDAYPDDAHRFRDLFDAQETRFEYKVYMTIGGEVPKSLDEQDAFLITGSPLSVLDTHIFTKDLVAFVRACDNAKKPLIGACFGHQVIADALGGTVKKSKNGYNVGVEKTHFFEKKPWKQSFTQPTQEAVPITVGFKPNTALALLAGLTQSAYSSVHSAYLTTILFKEAWVLVPTHTTIWKSSPFHCVAI